MKTLSTRLFHKILLPAALLYCHSLNAQTFEVVAMPSNSANKAVFPQNVVRPVGGLIKGPNLQNSNLRLYGLSEYGGTGGGGVLYSWEPATSTLRIEADFGKDFYSGSSPVDQSAKVGSGEHRIVAVSNIIYGVTAEGGTRGLGLIWKWDPSQATAKLTKLVDFDGTNSGSFPRYGVVADSSFLYGTCSAGGANNRGTLWKIGLSGSTITVLHDFVDRVSTTGLGQPTGGITLAGTTIWGLSDREDPTSGDVTNLLWSTSTTVPLMELRKTFNSATEGYPRGTLASKPSGTVFGVSYASPTSNNSAARLFGLNVTQNVDPALSSNTLSTSEQVSLLVVNNKLYGLAKTGSTAPTQAGLLFEWDGDDATDFTVKSNMASTNGPDGPLGLVHVESNGDIYGTSYAGGANGDGTIWKFTSSTQAITVQNSFQKPSLGGIPQGLVIEPNGNIFGTESLGGSVWRWNPITGLERMAAFTNATGQGSSPAGQVAVNGSGTVFGVATAGGTGGVGTVWNWTQHSGLVGNGSTGGAAAPGVPSGGCVAGDDGNIYGITNKPVDPLSGPETTLWKLTPAGVLSKVLTFNADSQGNFGLGALAKGPDGGIYGICAMGGEGAGSGGTLWKYVPGTGLTVLWPFSRGGNNANIESPHGGVAIAADGTVYGTSASRGGSETGRLWKWDPTTQQLARYSTFTSGLGSFIERPSGMKSGVSNILVAQVPIAISPTAPFTLYGVTDVGGSSNLGCGVLWSAPSGSSSLVAITAEKQFARKECDGGRGAMNLAFGPDSRLYGVTQNAIWRYGSAAANYTPTVVTQGVTFTNPTKLTFSGKVVANNANTTVTIQYGTSPTSLDYTLTPSPSSATGTTETTVTAQATILTPATAYYYRVVAVNAAGTSYGGIAKATTSASISSPVATTLAATSISHDSVTLNGTVTPKSTSLSTDNIFRYGLSATSQTLSIVATPPTATGAAAVNVSANLTGLQPHTKYYYKTTAAHDEGIANGVVMNFTTLNRKPAGTGETVVALPLVPVTIPVLTNDADPDGDAISIKTFTSPPAAQGKVTKVGNTLVFTPALTFTGTSFTYIIQDAFTGVSDPITVTVNLDVLSIDISSNPPALAAAAMTYPVAVDTGAAVQWKAVETSAFVSLSLTEGTGDQTVNVSVLANTGKTSRTATVQIGDKIHTITQPGVVPPVLVAPMSVPLAIVSGSFSMPISTTTPSLPAPVVTASKLPPGLAVKVNPTTGAITIEGKPDLPGVYDKVTVKATNASSTALNTSIIGPFTITVRALPTHMMGVHVGMVENNALFNKGIGATLTFTTKPNGAFTGSVRLGLGATAPETLPFSGRLDTVPAAEPNPVPPSTSLVSVPRKNLPPLTLTLTLHTAADSGDDIISGTLQEQGNAATLANLSGWRNKWSATLPATVLLDTKNKPTKEYYTTALTPPAGAELQSPVVPLGVGYTTFTLQPVGSVAWTTTLADGVVATGSTFLSPTTNEFLLWAPLYKKAVVDYLGVVRGKPAITRPADTVSASIQWKKAAQAAAPGVTPTYSYLTPFDLALTMTGARYTAPASIVLGLNNTFPNPNAILDFEQGGLANAAQNIAGDLDQTFVITTANKGTFNSADNPCLVTFSADKVNGLFSGTFSLTDGAVKRSKIAFKGVLLPDTVTPANARGRGFFNLPQLPTSGTSTTTEPRLSGSVELKPN